jgi:hypothetical protein
VQVLTMLYFFLWIFVGNYVLLNLFLAVLLDGFSVNADEEDDRIHDEMSLNKKQMPITNTEIDYDA